MILGSCDPEILGISELLGVKDPEILVWQSSWEPFVSQLLGVMLTVGVAGVGGSQSPGCALGTSLSWEDLCLWLGWGLCFPACCGGPSHDCVLGKMLWPQP